MIQNFFSPKDRTEYLHLLSDWQVDVSLPDLLQVGDQLSKGVPKHKNTVYMNIEVIA
jgi:hypothetical protein